VAGEFVLSDNQVSRRQYYADVSSATIKLFLLHGDANRLRTAEISNWNGKAIAAPRTDFDDLLHRDECAQSGVYILTGVDSDSGSPMAYIGEAEVIRDRIKTHKNRDFWNHAFVFVSKDENLTKAHVRYLEGRMLSDAQKAARARLANTQSSGAKLPESDREDMEVFLTKVHQLLPVLGADVFTSVLAPERQTILICEIKGLVARGQRTPAGFVVLAGSQAVAELRPSANAYLTGVRVYLVAEKFLVPQDTHYVFSKAREFSSPSAAAAIVCGGSMNGLTAWKDDSGRTLKEIEATVTA